MKGIEVGFVRMYLEDSLRGLYDEFCRDVIAPRKRRITARENIEKGNQVLTTLIQYVETHTDAETDQSH